MRVIAGKAKGRRLKVPEGPDIRPITDMIKGALFNTLGQYFDGENFLDLFAGSGAVGIEALSRNAKSVVFVEASPIAVKVIRENLTASQLEEGARVILGDVFKVLPRLAADQKIFNIIYIDPPFRKTDFYEPVMELVEPLMDFKSLVIIRSPKLLEMPQQIKGLVRVRANTYGDSILNFYKRLNLTT